jgi:hypothetical protein
MRSVRITALTVVLAASATALAAAAPPSLVPGGSSIKAALQPLGMPGSAMKRHGLLASQGVSSKKTHEKGWMAAKGPKVVNVKKS